MIFISKEAYEKLFSILIIVLGICIVLIGFIHIGINKDQANNSKKRTVISVENNNTEETFKDNPEIKILDQKEEVGEAVEKTQENDNVSTAVAISRNYEAYSTDLWYLACVIYHEGRGLSDEAQQAIASVVLNRVHSKSFPSNIFEVIVQPGQYSFVIDEIIDGTPDDRALANAEHVMLYGSQIPENVVYQSMGAQGSGVWKIIDGEYFCYE